MRSPDLHAARPHQVRTADSIAGPTEQVYLRNLESTTPFAHPTPTQLNAYNPGPASRFRSAVATAHLWLIVCCFPWVRRRRSFLQPLF